MIFINLASGHHMIRLCRICSSSTDMAYPTKLKIPKENHKYLLITWQFRSQDHDQAGIFFHKAIGISEKVLIFAVQNMVSVVQLVERQIVVLVVVGSSPTVHPKRKPTPKGRFSFCNVQRGFQLIWA